MAANSSPRDANIEIMRGIAVIIVVIYHYTSRLPPDAFGVDAPPALLTSIGKIGVYVFFVLSGYLIAQSIEKSGSLAAFYAKRVAQIWPLLVFASVVVFIAMKIGDPPVVLTGPDNFYHEQRSVIDLIGSVFFLSDFGFKWMDGAYWSILVEMKFYFMVGLFAAIFRNRFVDAFAIFALIVCGLDFAFLLTADPNGVAFAEAGQFRILSQIFHGIFISIYLPLFALGMMLYKGRLDALFMAIVCLTLMSAVVGIAEDGKFNVKHDLVFLGITAAALALDKFLTGSRVFLWLGRYSYSIYLFHQMIGLTIMKAVAPSLGINAAIVLALVCVLLIARVASWLVEWRFYRNIVNLLNAAFRLIGLDRIALADPATPGVRARAPGPVSPQPGE